MYMYMLYIHMYTYTVGVNGSIVHVLMRDEKEGRKKQARSNKQQSKSNTPNGSHFS